LFTEAATVVLVVEVLVEVEVELATEVDVVDVVVAAHPARTRRPASAAAVMRVCVTDPA